MADAALLYKNVGDGINEVSQASASIISTLKAFGMEARDAIQVVDKFNETGKSFGVSSKGVGDALLRSAGSLAAANNTLDESIGLVAAANRAVEDEGRVGAGLDAIALRVRGAKAELESAGAATEGMADSTAALRREVMALSGVDIAVSGDALKSTYQILDELADRWRYLSEAQQAGITALFAGAQDADIFDSLLSNFETARQAAEVSAGSMGSAWAENEAYLDSIEGKLGALSAQFEELSSIVIDDGWAKGILSGGTTALGMLTDIVNLFGTMPTLIAAITAAASIKHNSGKVNMPATWEVGFHTTKWASCFYQTRGEPLNCLGMAKAA